LGHPGSNIDDPSTGELYHWTLSRVRLAGRNRANRAKVSHEPAARPREYEECMGQGASRGTLDPGPLPAEEFGLPGGDGSKGRSLLCQAANPPASATIPSPMLQSHLNFADTAAKACWPQMSAPAPNLILPGRNLMPRAGGLLEVTATRINPNHL
jgi:hypothetical protein